jgi:CxxC motif-containing protein (DUF1111 family)
MRRMAVATAAMLAIVGVGAVARGDFGDPLAGSTQTEIDAFSNGRISFSTAETPDEGLGPVFNDVSCSNCHTGPGSTIGGNTTRTEIRFGTTTNGLFDPLTQLGGSLIQNQGIGKDGIDKSIHGCAPVRFVGETVPAAATIQAQRRTTPLFGLGLVDATPDTTFTQLAASQPVAIRGKVSTPPDVEPQQQNHVGRFGWKAQNATLHIFAGDAYVNEMGITNPSFPNENCPQGDCSKLVCLSAPELNDADGADVTAFTDFMTFLAPPPRGSITQPVTAGEAVFNRIGCNGCHVANLTTGTNASTALSGVLYHPYSDFLLHDMGGLGDGITQNNATGNLMRTAPLWGLRTQTTLLHDGRATNVTQAIAAHNGGTAHPGQGAAAAAAFAGLNATDRANLLAFLASL